MNYKKIFVLSLSLIMLVGCGGASEGSTSNEGSNDKVPPKEEVYTLSVKGTGSKSEINLDSFTSEGGFKLESFDHVYYDDRASGYVKMGSHNNFGSLNFTSTTPVKIKNLSITAKQYYSSKAPKLEVKLGNGETSVANVTSQNDDTYNFSFTGAETTSFSISSMVKEERVYLKSISFTAGVLDDNKPVEPSTPDIEDSTTPSNPNPVGPNNDTYHGSYYTNLDDSLSGDALVIALEKLISNGHRDNGYSGLWGAYKTTDVKPNSNIIWDMYSNCTFHVGKNDQCGSYKREGDCYNREHSIPQSWFNEQSPMKSDVHHIVPTDGYVNNIRSNYPFGEVSSATYTSSNGSKLGKDKNGSGTVFEPIDEYKGDFARMYFYMATRYRSRLKSWNNQPVFSSSYPYMHNKYLDLYRKWAINDPVSQKEIDRNEAAYRYQGNRNPYIDHASYLTRAFGN